MRCEKVAPTILIGFGTVVASDWPFFSFLVSRSFFRPAVVWAGVDACCLACYHCIQQIFAASGQNQRKSKTFASTSSLNYQSNDNERRRRILRGEGRRQEDQRGQGKLLKPLLFLMSAFLARLLTEYQYTISYMYRNINQLTYTYYAYISKDTLLRVTID